MNSFQVDFSWEAPLAAKGPELRATWAQLRLQADDVPITQVVDDRTTAIRNGIYLPLYPLAEWLATHWWSLLYEVQSPTRPQKNLYNRRHDFRYAREGYALPGLRVLPTGRSVRLEWQAENLPEKRVRFVTSGTAQVDLCIFQSQLTRLVEATLDRLEQQGITDTFLHDEWRAIRDADDEERAFCRAAAQLGLDAFDLSEEESQTIVDAAACLPAKMADEFFSIAKQGELSAQSAAICHVIRDISRKEEELPSLVSLKTAMPAIDQHATPWEIGYKFAGRVRQILGLNGTLVRTNEELCESLRVPVELWHAAQLPFRDECDFVSAIVAVNGKMSPGFLIEKRRDDSRRFAFCRALFEFLTLDSGSPSLVSEARSHRQQCNRAFAAEFLAPAATLRQMIGKDTISEEDVNEIAAKCGTSPFVVRHQVENSKIAEIVPEA